MVLTIRISLRSRTLFLVAFTRRVLLVGVSAPISQLNITADVKNVFQHAFNQGLFQMAGVVRVAEADNHSLIVLVDWVGFKVDERTWEPFREIFEVAPDFLAKELRKLRVTRAFAARIKAEFGIQL